jgi:hypothetical protein
VRLSNIPSLTANFLCPNRPAPYRKLFRMYSINVRVVSRRKNNIFLSFSGAPTPSSPLRHPQPGRLLPAAVLSRAPLAAHRAHLRGAAHFRNESLPGKHQGAPGGLGEGGGQHAGRRDAADCRRPVGHDQGTDSISGSCTGFEVMAPQRLAIAGRFLPFRGSSFGFVVSRGIQGLYTINNLFNLLEPIARKRTTPQNGQKPG